MSDDGAHCGFTSYATNLVLGDNNNEQDCFVRGENHNLAISPSTVKIGNQVKMTQWGAYVFIHWYLWLLSVNGTPSAMKIYKGSTDATGPSPKCTRGSLLEP